jgi:hypothetical protein
VSLAEPRKTDFNVTSYSCTTDKGGRIAVFISQANEQGGRNRENCVGRYVRLPTFGKDTVLTTSLRLKRA